MAITAPVEGTAYNQTVAGTTQTPGYPSNIAVGDLLVLQVVTNGGGTAITVPAGWTQVFQPSVSTNPKGLVAIKVATGLETGTLSVTTPSVTGFSTIWKISGVDTTTPQDVAAVNVEDNSGADDTVDIPTMTTVTDNAMVMLFAAANTGSTNTWTGPGTELLDSGAPRSYSKAGAAYYFMQPTAGATGTQTVTIGAGPRAYWGLAMALRPAPEVTVTHLAATAITTGGSPKTVAVGGTPAGAWLIAYMSYYDSGGAEGLSVTAPDGTTSLTQLGEVATAGNYHLEIWGVYSASGFPAGNVSFATSPAGALGGHFGALFARGIKSSSPLNGSLVGAWRVGGSNTTATWTSGAKTVAVGDLLIGVAFADGMTNGANVGTPGNSFTEVSDVNVATQDWGQVAAYKIAASTSETYSGTWNLDPAFGDGAAVIALTPAAASAPATAAGQYGWGTYGLGNYGPSFGATSSTPISGSEAFAFTEGATVIAISSSNSDSWVLSETSAKTSTDAITASETHTHSDGTAAVTTVDAITASETHTETDATPSIAASLSRWDVQVQSEGLYQAEGPPGAGVYGNPYTGDFLANINIGKVAGKRSSYRFRADASGALNAVRVYLIYTSSPGYYGGTGGSVRLDLKEDASGLPDGATIASSTVITDPMTSNFRDIAFPTNPFIERGHLYHLEFVNTDADPVTNYVSFDDVGSGANYTPRQPFISDTDLAVVHKFDTATAWTDLAAHTPIFTLKFTDGSTHGPGAPLSNVRSGSGIHDIQGTAQVSQRFTPTVPRVVTAASFRVQKVASPGNLTFKLEETAGTLIDTGSVTAASIGSNGWATYSFAAPITLNAGTEYRLSLSAAADAVNKYTAYPSTEATGFNSPWMFTEGYWQYSDNSGGSWTTLGATDDAQFYFTLLGSTIQSQTGLSATDSQTHTEGASSISAAAATSDSWAFSEVSAIAADLATSDPAVFTDSSSLAQTTFISAVDSWVVTEGTASISSQNSVSANDSWNLSDVSSLSAALGASDTQTHSDGTGSIAASASLVDSWVLSELSSLADTLSAADSATQTETVNSVGEQASYNTSDSGTQSEDPTALSATTAASETHTVTDASSGALNVTVVDATTFGEAVAIAAALATTDSSTFTDIVNTVGEQADKIVSDSAVQSDPSATVTTTDLKTASETFGFTENSAVSAALDALDSATQTDISSLSVALLLSDTATQAEGVAGVAESRLLSVSDAQTLSESALREFIEAIAASDSLALTTESAIVLVPSPSPYVRQPTTAIVVPVSASAVIEAMSTSADIAEALTKVEVTGHAYTVEIDEKSGIATVTAKMSSVNLDPHAP